MHQEKLVIKVWLQTNVIYQFNTTFSLFTNYFTHTYPNGMNTVTQEDIPVQTDYFNFRHLFLYFIKKVIRFNV